MVESIDRGPTVSGPGTLGTAPINGRRSNGRACVSCHQRKVRCDIADKGVPCTGCALHHKPDCRVYLKKRERSSVAQSQRKPKRPLYSKPPIARDTDKPPPSASPSSGPSATSLPTPKDQDAEDHDSGNLTDFLGREDVRDKVIDHRGRMCFIGTEMSNWNYLVRQSVIRSSSNNTGIHLGNRQFHLKHTAHNLQRVPAEAFERPDKELADRLVRAYFEHVNRGWPVLDEGDFMVSYGGQNPRVPLSLPLLNAVFLVGAFILAPEDETIKPLQSVFFQRAKTLIDYRYEQDRMVYVQTALLMTWYSDGLEEIVANAWHWIGIAARAALGLGMHRDVTHSRMLAVHKRTWTRLYWVLFQFDTIIAASNGKPQIMNIDDCDVPELEEHHFEGIPEAEIDFVINHSRLCVVISKTMRERWALRSSAESKISATRQADTALADLMIQMPQRLELSLPILNVWQAMFHLTYNNFLIILHRPPPPPRKYELLDAVNQACSDVNICRDANTAIISIFDSLRSQGLLSKAWLFTSHALFTALVHVANEFDSSNPLVIAKYRRTFESLIASLRELARHWRFAQGLLALFEFQASRLRQKLAARETTDEDGRGISSEVSRDGNIDIALRQSGMQLHSNTMLNSPSSSTHVQSENVHQTGTSAAGVNIPAFSRIGPTEPVGGTGSNHHEDFLLESPSIGYYGEFLDLGITEADGDLLFGNMSFLDTASLDLFLGGEGIE